MMRILAAVVTHNRADLLTRCLDHVAAQTRPADQTLVIDNASTDRTPAMLAQRQADDPTLVVITQPNVGSAGGWHRAIEHALANGFDAIWLMDDDGFPDRAALAHLAPALTEDAAAVSSIVVREDAPDRFVFPFPRLDRAGLPVIFGWPRKLARVEQLAAICDNGRYPFVHFFNGALISCRALARAGNVERDFFLFGEEADLFFRLRQIGTVHSVLAARHNHPDVSARPYSAAKVYYYVKNTLILHARYFNMVALRNLLALGIVLVRVGRRNGWAEAASYVAGRRAGSYWGAVVRGLKGRVGKDFGE